MIMTRNDDGTYGQVGFIKDVSGADIEYIKDKNGVILFEKGFSREKSGALPLQLEGIGKPLKDYAIYGNTYQAEGVSPDNPQEVVGSGDRTANLLKLKEDYTTDVRGVSVSTKNGALTLKGTATAGGGRHIYLSENIILPSGTYYVRGDYVSGLSYHIATVSDNVSFNTSQTTSYTFTLTEETEVALGINVVSGKTYDATVYVMLNEGETALPYEPYGYKLDVKTTENLIDKTVFIDNKQLAPSTGIPQAYEGRIATDTPIDVSSISTLTMIFSLGTIKNEYFMYSLFKNDGTFIERVAGKQSGDTIDVSNADKLYIGFYIGGTNITVNDIQKIVLYEKEYSSFIYIDNPIHKIGNYTDILSYSGKSVERVLKELILTGDEEGWLLNTVITATYAFQNYELISDYKREPFICTHMPVTSNSSATNTHGFYGQRLTLCFAKSSGLSDVDKFKAYLKEQYNNGTPVKLYYVLAAPVTETVELPEIPTLDGTTVIDVDTAVQPSEMQIKYKSKI